MKLKTVLLATIALLLLYPNPFAQTDPPDSYVFGGGEYDSGEKAFTTTVGAAGRLVGGLWALARTQVGQYGSLETDLGYFVTSGGALRFGLIAGPNVDWVTQEDADPISYIVGASGFAAGYAPKKVGIWFTAKYKFAFDGDSYYQDGWQGGLWLSYGL